MFNTSEIAKACFGQFTIFENSIEVSKQSFALRLDKNDLKQ